MWYNGYKINNNITVTQKYIQFIVKHNIVNIKLT